MFTRRQALLGVAGAAALVSMPPLTAVGSAAGIDGLPREKVKLVGAGRLNLPTPEREAYR